MSEHEMDFMPKQEISENELENVSGGRVVTREAKCFKCGKTVPIRITDSRFTCPYCSTEQDKLSYVNSLLSKLGTGQQKRTK